MLSKSVAMPGTVRDNPLLCLLLPAKDTQRHLGGGCHFQEPKS